MAVINTNIFGIRLEVPMGSFAGSRRSGRFRYARCPDGSVGYLAESELQSDIDMDSDYAKARGLSKSRDGRRGGRRSDQGPLPSAVHADRAHRFPAFDGGEPL